MVWAGEIKVLLSSIVGLIWSKKREVLLSKFTIDTSSKTWRAWSVLKTSKTWWTARLFKPRLCCRLFVRRPRTYLVTARKTVEVIASRKSTARNLYWLWGKITLKHIQIDALISRLPGLLRELMIYFAYGVLFF